MYNTLCIDGRSIVLYNESVLLEELSTEEKSITVPGMISRAISVQNRQEVLKPHISIPSFMRGAPSIASSFYHRKW